MKEMRDGQARTIILQCAGDDYRAGNDDQIEPKRVREYLDSWRVNGGPEIGRAIDTLGMDAAVTVYLAEYEALAAGEYEETES